MKDTYIIVEGNVVRKIDYINEQKRKVKREKQFKKINFKYMFVCILSAGMLLFSSINYLQMQSNVTMSMENINKMQKKYYDLKKENDNKYNRILMSVDLLKIKDQAMNELGMDYPTANQIVYYTPKSSDSYVIQYKSVD